MCSLVFYSRDREMKTILATNIRPEQEISKNVKVGSSNLLTVKCSCKNNCASFWKKKNKRNLDCLF